MIATRSAFLATLLPLLCATAAAAQHTPEIGVRLGIASPDPAYTSGCGYGHPGASLELRGRGNAYSLITATAYGGGAGSDILCIGGGAGEGSWTYRDGGADPAGVVRLTAGWGRRITLPVIAIESEGAIGVLRARPGYDETGSGSGARILPVGTVAVGATVVRHLHVGWEQTWTRLRYRDEVHVRNAGDAHAPPPQPGTGLFEIRESARWAVMNELRIGLRF
jgi:hypothetical protein